MNEAELAEDFNRELDAVLNGGEPDLFRSDPGAMALAAAFARADFSGESKIKESLRQRIAAAPGLAETLRGLFSGGYARAAFAAAVLALALLPLVRRPAPVPLPASPAAGLIKVSAPALPLPVPGGAGPGQAVFASLPMPALRGEPINSFPIEPAGRMNIAMTGGREVSLENGSGIVWETEGAALTLERRVIKPEDLFQVRTL